MRSNILRQFFIASIGVVSGIIKIRKKPTFERPFNFNDISDRDCRRWFRFEKKDLDRLRKALRIPDHIVITQRDRATGLEALCIVLRRLTYPNRIFELTKLLGRSHGPLSRLFNHTLFLIYRKHKSLLGGIVHPWMEDGDLQKFAEKVQEKGAPMKVGVGFIDGTMRSTCRPGKNQKAAYSGHKRNHGLKYQATMFPNGIISHLYGPLEGCRHDAGMLRESGLIQILAQHFHRPDGSNYCLYGDPAYPLSPYLLSPFKGATLAGSEQEWNRRMSSVRQAVEWGFGNVVSKWAFVDFKKNQKLYLQPVGLYYGVAVILTNCLNCLYSNQTSQYFRCSPPSLERYLGAQVHIE